MRDTMLRRSSCAPRRRSLKAGVMLAQDRVATCLSPRGGGRWRDRDSFVPVKLRCVAGGRSEKRRRRVDAPIGNTPRLGSLLWRHVSGQVGGYATTAELFLGGLSFDVNESDIKADCKTGEIEDLFPPTSGRHKGFCFITFRDAAGAGRVQGAPPAVQGRDISASVVSLIGQQAAAGPAQATGPASSAANVFASKTACFKCGAPANGGYDRGYDRDGDRFGGDRRRPPGGDRYDDRRRDDRYDDRAATTVRS